MDTSKILGKVQCVKYSAQFTGQQSKNLSANPIPGFLDEQFLVNQPKYFAFLHADKDIRKKESRVSFYMGLARLTQAWHAQIQEEALNDVQDDLKVLIVSKTAQSKVSRHFENKLKALKQIYYTANQITRFIYHQYSESIDISFSFFKC